MVSVKRLKDWIKDRWFEIVSYTLGMVVVGILVWLTFFTVHAVTTLREKDNHIKTMQTEHTKSINALQQELDISRANAVGLQKQMTKAQQGISSPASVFYVTEGDTEAVRDLIESEDATLPKEALKETDRTIVVDQSKTNKAVPVGVYKVNLYRNWEVGIGAGVEDGRSYVPVSIQRNYDRTHSVCIEAHYSPVREEISGFEVQYKWRF